MSTIIPPAYVTQAEELYGKSFDPNIFRRIWQFIRPYRKQLIIALLFMLGSSTTSVLGPYFVKLAIDNGLAQKNVIALRNTVLFYLRTSQFDGKGRSINHF
jgi:ABC-type multidrug transport system fused ATPase/permease subunit